MTTSKGVKLLYLTPVPVGVTFKTHEYEKYESFFEEINKTVYMVSNGTKKYSTVIEKT